MIKTYEPVVRHGLAGWDRKKISPEELQQRLSRIRAAMRARKLAVLVIHGDARQYGDLCYATHFAPMVHEAVAFIPREENPVLYVGVGPRDIPFARKLTSVEEVHPLARLEGEIGLRLRYWLPKQGRVGLVNVQESMRAPLYERLLADLADLPLEPCTAWYHELRLRKTVAELAVMREATQRLDRCFEAILAALRPAVSERDLAVEADYAARRQGAEDCRVLITSGPDADRFLRPATVAPIAPRGRLLVYVALAYERYWSELGSTIILPGGGADLSPADVELARLYDELRQGLAAGDAGLHVLRQAGEALRQHLEAHQATGEGELQGIGLDREEAPLLPLLGAAAETAAPLRPGMVVSPRVLRFAAGAGALCAEPLVLGESGCERLSQTERVIMRSLE